jgi:GH18 family chitinase
MSQLLQDEVKISKFSDDAVQLLRRFEFDGLDLDFECAL